MGNLQLNPSVDPRDAVALREQNLAILALLQLRPRTSAELAHIALKYTSRISELRQAGYAITAKRSSGRTFIYTLVSEPKGNSDDATAACDATGREDCVLPGAGQGGIGEVGADGAARDPERDHRADDSTGDDDQRSEESGTPTGDRGVSRTGVVLGRWEMRLGECIEGMKELADKSVDHVICDPPFEAEAHTLQRRVKRGGGVMSVEPLTFPPMTEAERDDVAEQIARVARRWVIVFCQIEAAQKWVFSLGDAGLTYRRTCIWVKPDGMPQYSGDRPGMGYETMVVMHAPGKSTWNGGGRTGVFRHNKNDPNRTGHPTQKPETLMSELVSLFTDPDELILDPYAGSGTTGVAAVRLGRRFIGFERDEGFHAMASRRIANAAAQPSLFEVVRAVEQGSLFGGGK